MKNIFKALRATILVAVVAIFASCEQDVVYKYVNLSDVNFSLDYAGEEEFSIAVDASGEWSYTINDSWILEVECDGANLVVSAEPNPTTAMRVGTISFTQGEATNKAIIFQSGRPNANIAINNLFALGVVSPGGNYVAGLASYDDDYYIPVLIDTYTNETKVYDMVSSNYVISCVDDNGNMFLSSSMLSSAGYSLSYDGTLAELDVPDTFWAGGVTCCSADGTVWAGFGLANGGGWYALRWTNGIPEELQTPETNGTGKEAIWYGIIPRGCSDDGKLIYGNIMDYQEAIYWDEYGNVNFVAPELMELEVSEYEGSYYYSVAKGALQFADDQKISPNGKYLAFNYYSSGTYYPAYIDVTTGLYEILYDYAGMTIITIDNDGSFYLIASSVYGATTILPQSGDPFDSRTWLLSAYAVIVEDARSINQVSASGNLFGYSDYGDSYVCWWATVD